MDPTPARNGRPKGRPGLRRQFHLDREIIQKMTELSEALHIPQTSVVSLAIARMHGEEPLLHSNGRRRKEKK